MNSLLRIERLRPDIAQAPAFRAAKAGNAEAWIRAALIQGNAPESLRLLRKYGTLLPTKALLKLGIKSILALFRGPFRRT